MKSLKLLLILLAALPAITQAGETTTLSRSASKLVNDQSIELTQQLSSSPLQQTTGAGKPRVSDDSSATIAASNLQYRLSDQAEWTDFEIYDAWAELSGDLDYDSYYHRIKVSFDADVNSPTETVYAKLYLSLQGGPWKQYASSDLFEIRYNSAEDSYEVVSELIEGYPPGIYDVLVELHSLFHPGIVASRVLYHDESDYGITLEDLDHDQQYREEYVVDSYSYSSAGSFSWAGLILLGLLLIIKFRYFRRDYCRC